MLFQTTVKLALVTFSPAPDPVPVESNFAAPVSDFSGLVTFTSGQEELKVPPFVPLLQKPVGSLGFCSPSLKSDI